MGEGISVQQCNICQSNYPATMKSPGTTWSVAREAHERADPDVELRLLAAYRPITGTGPKPRVSTAGGN